MASGTDVLRFLSGGITSLIGDDGGDGAKPLQGTEASPVQRPEETPPTPRPGGFLLNVTQPQILGITAVLVVIIGALAFARR